MDIMYIKEHYSTVLIKFFFFEPLTSYLLANSI